MQTLDLRQISTTPSANQWVGEFVQPFVTP